MAQKFYHWTITNHAVDRYREYHPVHTFNPVKCTHVPMRGLGDGDIRAIIAMKLDHAVELTPHQRTMFQSLIYASRSHISVDDSALRYDDLVFFLRGNSRRVVTTILRVDPELFDAAQIHPCGFSLCLSQPIEEELKASGILGDALRTEHQLLQAFRTMIADGAIGGSELAQELFGQVGGHENVTLFAADHEAIRDGETRSFIVAFLVRTTYLPSCPTEPVNYIIRCRVFDTTDERQESRTDASSRPTTGARAISEPNPEKDSGRAPTAKIYRRPRIGSYTLVVDVPVEQRLLPVNVTVVVDLLARQFPLTGTDVDDEHQFNYISWRKWLRETLPRAQPLNAHEIRTVRRHKSHTLAFLIPMPPQWQHRGTHLVLTGKRVNHQAVFAKLTAFKVRRALVQTGASRDVPL